ncbi:hypothetical protein STENM36S_02911 [Streptomyces tendae]
MNPAFARVRVDVPATGDTMAPARELNRRARVPVLASPAPGLAAGAAAARLGHSGPAVHTAE